jgi:predicted O-methyltransferase YrrM
MNIYWCKIGHLNLDQAEYMKEIINQIEPKYVLETGFCTGRSASVLLQNCKKLEKMISIDIDLNYRKPHGKLYSKLFMRHFKNFKLIENDSKKVFNKKFFEIEFPNGIDWFTVDGDHTYEGCLYDLNNVYKYMNKNGVIIIDDYKSGKPNGCEIPDVTNACDTFYNEHPEIKKIEWYKDGKGFCVFKF